LDFYTVELAGALQRTCRDLEQWWSGYPRTLENLRVRLAGAFRGAGISQELWPDFMLTGPGADQRDPARPGSANATSSSSCAKHSTTRGLR
jgi:hypothetical protein